MDARDSVGPTSCHVQTQYIYIIYIHGGDRVSEFLVSYGPLRRVMMNGRATTWIESTHSQRCIHRALAELKEDGEAFSG